MLAIRPLPCSSLFEHLYEKVALTSACCSSHFSLTFLLFTRWNKSVSCAHKRGWREEKARRFTSFQLGRVPLLARHAGGARRDFISTCHVVLWASCSWIPAKWRLHSLWMSSGYPLLTARHLARPIPARHNKWKKSPMNGPQRPEDVWFIFLTLLK